MFGNAEYLFSIGPDLLDDLRHLILQFFVVLPEFIGIGFFRMFYGLAQFVQMMADQFDQV